MQNILKPQAPCAVVLHEEEWIMYTKDIYSNVSNWYPWSTLNKHSINTPSTVGWKLAECRLTHMYYQHLIVCLQDLVDSQLTVHWDLDQSVDQISIQMLIMCSGLRCCSRVAWGCWLRVLIDALSAQHYLAMSWLNPLLCNLHQVLNTSLCGSLAVELHIQKLL